MNELFRFEVFEKFVLKMKEGQQLTISDKNEIILNQYEVNYLNIYKSGRGEEFLLFEIFKKFVLKKGQLTTIEKNGRWICYRII